MEIEKRKRRVEFLIQKYLRGETSRDEERELLDFCLKEINYLISIFRKWNIYLLEKRKLEY